MRKVICAYCKKQFSTSHHSKITCSADCAYFRMLEINAKAYRVALAKDRACKICGVVFSATDSRRVLCSQDCVDINQRNHYLAHTAKKKTIKKIDVKQCKYCSAPITDDIRKKYCNSYCSYLAKLTPQTALLVEETGKIEDKRNCKRCNKEFAWNGKRNAQTHCSDFCAYETKKQLHREYAAKKRRERTSEQKEAVRKYRNEWAARHRARNNGIPNHMNC